MIKRMRFVLAAGLICGFGLWARPAAAWNSPGHMIIALVAFDQMDAATREKAIALLSPIPASTTTSSA